MNGSCLYDTPLYLAPTSHDSYPLENNKAGKRVDVDSRKRNPAEFVLWKNVRPSESSQDNPWDFKISRRHVEFQHNECTLFDLQI
ncbi:unnamed protein product, partial [Vitis vinifera]|uniref:Uncharacterized protein n=1 Tax=Vitis vinifera TaxID=29760 RepID=D7TDC5_VITVI